jgi:hypothetical protein
MDSWGLARCIGEMVNFRIVIALFLVPMTISNRLGDLREGRCSYGFFYNSNACCTGIDRMFLPRPSSNFLSYAFQRVKFAENGKPGVLTSRYNPFLHIPFYKRLHTLYSLCVVALTVQQFDKSYLSFKVAFSGSAAILVVTYAPQ